MIGGLSFEKWEATGNDFVLLRSAPPADSEASALAIQLCHRQFGVGADGLVYLSDLKDDAECRHRMTLFNSDGSRAAMCGNVLRCLALRLVEEGAVAAEQWFSVSTDSGPRRVRARADGQAQVDMGIPTVQPAALVQRLGVCGWLVNMGNPHLVLMAPDGAPPDWQALGAALQADYPGGINVEWATPNASELTVQVWERGAGATLACGTGACAAAAVAIGEGLAAAPVSTRLPGGVLAISWAVGGSILKTGPARRVFRGSWEEQP